MEPREFLQAVAMKCPAYREHLPDCALASLRPGGDPSGVPACVAELDDAATDELVRRHLLCLCRRDGCGPD
jgi:hypothetical protein